MSPLFGPKIGADQKKGHCRQISGFSAQKYVKSKTKLEKKRSSTLNWLVSDPNENVKKDLHRKSVEIWFRFIMWCHPKMVTPGTGRLLRPLLATPLLLGFFCFFTFLLAFLGFTAFSLSFSINSSKSAESCRTIALSCKSISNEMKPLQTSAATHREYLHV